jgi:hypothetical protein
MSEKPSMRRLQRIVSAAVLIALSSALAGCSSSISNWDPMDMFDFLDTKKKLPGDRKPVFPDGVPGLEQGVPKELYKGNVEQQQQQQQAVAVAPPPADDSKAAKKAAKSKAKPSTASTQDPDAAAAAGDGAAPAPKPKKHRRSAPKDNPDGQPPAQDSQSQDSQPQSANPSFPAPVPGGTFQR